MTIDTEQGQAAASMPGLRLVLSRYLVVSDVVGPQDRRMRVVFSTRTGQALTMAESIWVLLKDGRIAELPSETVELLAEAELLVPANEDELATVLRRSDEGIATSGVLKIVVQPTAACQLGCGYCGQEHTAARLCGAHQDAIIDRARANLRDGSYDTIFTGWFGSEPLLGIDVIRSLTPRLRSLAEEFGCAYKSTVVSNGLRLDLELAAELVDLGVSFIEVTVDGLPHHHDRQRPYKSGRSSFGRIMRNVVTVARSDIDLPISIRCNVTAESAPDVGAFIDMLSDLGLQDDLYRVYFAPIHSWGNDADKLSLERPAYAALELGWLFKLTQLGFDIPPLPEPKPVVCMATSRSGELVDAHGEVFNCTEVSYVPAYGSPNRYSLGHVTTGTDPKRRNLLADFNRRIERAEVPCHSCHLLPVCGGSCPKAWHEGDAPCPGFKWYLPERLLMELPRSQLAPRLRPARDLDDVLADYAPGPQPAASTPVVIQARPSTSSNSTKGPNDGRG